MIISLIAAMSENRVIGAGNRIPWSIPSDLKRFNEITMGHPVIFGRKTFESIGRPLQGRKNIILTEQRNYRIEGASVVHSLADALNLCSNEDEVFICGGGPLYQETISRADRIYLTVVHHIFEGDTFFPEIPAEFAEISREEVREEIPYSVVRYERRL
jgi:dihydrofolate reductase